MSSESWGEEPRTQPGGSKSASLSALPSASLPIPLLLGSEAFKVLFPVWPGLPVIPRGPDQGFGEAQRTTHEAALPRTQDPDGWAPLPLHSLPRLPPLLLGPFPTSPSHLAIGLCPRPLPSCLPSPPPRPGQADAIGASSFRDPVPPVSLVCLLSPIPPPSVPLRTPEPKTQCHLPPTRLLTQSALAIGLPSEG